MSDINGQCILLTGATGFVGSHLARRLVQERCELHAVVRPGADLSALDGLGSCLTIHSHDGSTEDLVRTVADVRPELVFHLASLFLSEHASADVERLVAANVLFGTQLLESMDKAGVRLLVNTGTSWQHFQGADYSPVNLYAATKQAFEAILGYYIEAAEFTAVTLKLYDTYGPGDKRPKLLRLLQNVAEQGEPLAMSPGEQLIDLVYIDDVIDAFLVAGGLLLDGRTKGHCSYAVSSSAPVRLRDLVAVFSRALGREIPIVWGGRPYRSREVMEPWQGPALPGWAPKVTLEEGFRKFLGHSGLLEREEGPAARV